MTPSPAASLEYRDLTDADLRRDLRGARLRGARLLDVDLRGADLRGADLRGVLAQWTATSLDGARLDGCDLRDADFSGVDAQAATFEAADLEGSRWDRADLRGARLAGARLGWHSIWLANVAAGREGGQPALFDDADLRESDLTGIQLPGASLRRADLRGARASGAVLTGTRLTGANLASANLTGADLCEADLREAVLDRADLCGAALLGARLIGTRIDGTVLDGARLGGTVLAGLSGAGPKSATGVVHLAPSVTDGTVPAELRQPGTPGDADDRDAATVTCLLAGENDNGHFQRTRRALGDVGLKCYVASPHSLSSPAGRWSQPGPALPTLCASLSRRQPGSSQRGCTPSGAPCLISRPGPAGTDGPARIPGGGRRSRPRTPARLARGSHCEARHHHRVRRLERRCMACVTPIISAIRCGSARTTPVSVTRPGS